MAHLSEPPLIDPHAVGDGAARRRRGPRRVTWPLLFVLLLAVVWSGFWFWAAHKAGEVVDQAIVDQARQGRTIACADRSVGGYPFRLEVSCSNARLDVARSESRFSATSPRVLAVAQVYDPRRVILEVASPVTVTTPDDGRELTATWSNAEASAHLTFGGADRGDLVIDGLAATLAQSGAAAVPLVTGARLEGHVRAAPDAAAGTYDVAALLMAQAVPPLDQRLGSVQPATIELQGTVTHLAGLGPAPMPDRLRLWQSQGGALRVDLARVTRGPSAVRATGDLGLDTEGRPAGRLAVALAGVPELATSLKSAGLASGNIAPLLGVGLNFLGKPSNIDGKPAVEVPLTLQNGSASIGAFPLGRLKSLFRPEQDPT